MPIAATAFDYIRDLVRQRSAIVLEPGKEYLVEARLLALARTEQIASLDVLVQKLHGNPHGELARKVVEAMTTNETSFFRDVHPFEAMRRTLLPQLIQKREVERRLNIWCAAASSGQEPYTIAMLIREHFPILTAWNLRILATDISAEMIDRCKKGIFSQIEINRGLPAPMMVKYFEKQGLSWQANHQLRQMIEFRTMNLIEPWPPMPEMDIVFIRNVLIYFDVETKRQILSKVRRLLRPDGYMFLGGAETTFSIDDSFERQTIDQASCYRQKRA